MKLLLVIVALVVLYKCSNSNDDYKSQTIANCVQQNASKSDCECVYGEFEKHYPMEEMKKMDASKQFPSDFQQVMLKAIEKCSK